MRWQPQTCVSWYPDFDAEDEQDDDNDDNDNDDNDTDDNDNDIDNVLFTIIIVCLSDSLDIQKLIHY